LDRHGGLSLALRRALAREAFAHSAAYDAAITRWLGEQPGPAEEWPPPRIAATPSLREPIRYGENPHQRAALYAAEGSPGPFGGAEVLQGKEMSFNNWLHADAAR